LPSKQENNIVPENKIMLAFYLAAPDSGMNGFSFMVRKYYFQKSIFRETCGSIPNLFKVLILP
jgi:hypothetical protein